jgi:hypothetical protein
MLSKEDDQDTNDTKITNPVVKGYFVEWDAISYQSSEKILRA